MCSGIGTMQLVAWTLNIFLYVQYKPITPASMLRERESERGEEREKHKHDSMRIIKI